MYMQELVSYDDDFCSWFNQVTDAVIVILADTGTDVEYEVIIDRLKDNNIISQDPSSAELEDTIEIIDEQIAL